MAGVTAQCTTNRARRRWWWRRKRSRRWRRRRIIIHIQRVEDSVTRNAAIVSARCHADSDFSVTTLLRQRENRHTSRYDACFPLISQFPEIPQLLSPFNVFNHDNNLINEMTDNRRWYEHARISGSVKAVSNRLGARILNANSTRSSPPSTVPLWNAVFWKRSAKNSNWSYYLWTSTPVRNVTGKIF